MFALYMYIEGGTGSDFRIGNTADFGSESADSTIKNKENRPNFTRI